MTNKSTRAERPRPEPNPSLSAGPRGAGLRPPASGILWVDQRAAAKARVEAALRSGDASELEAALDSGLRLENSIRKVEAEMAAQRAREEREKAAWLAKHPDLGVPSYARAVMGKVSAPDRARLRTGQDYAGAVADYETGLQVDALLPAVPSLHLTEPTLDVHSDEMRAQQADERASRRQARAALRAHVGAQGSEAATVDAMDDDEVASRTADAIEAQRLAADPMANDALGDSKGPINHFLDGAEHGLFKIGHDIGNLGLSAGFAFDAITQDQLPEEPQWYGAAGRSRGSTPSLGGLAWELAGNIPLIGKAQVLYGAWELAKGAYHGDWNNVAYGVGNLSGALMFGQALGALPLAPGSFSATGLGKATAKATGAARSWLLDEPAYSYRSRVPAEQRLPSGEVYVDPRPPGSDSAVLSARLSNGTPLEVAPHSIGGTGPAATAPDVARGLINAAHAVDAVLPRGNKISPSGKPVTIVRNADDPIPSFQRASGELNLPPDFDQPHVFPTSGPGSELARWAPDPGARPSEGVAMHELGHSALPEVFAMELALGAKVKALSVQTFIAMLRGNKDEAALARSKSAQLQHQVQLVQGLDELGADAVAVAASRDLSANPKALSSALGRALELQARDPSAANPGVPENPALFLERRDFASKASVVPGMDEAVAPHEVFSDVRRHLGQRYGPDLTGPKAPQVLEVLVTTQKEFMGLMESADSAASMSTYVDANRLFIQLFDANARAAGLAGRPSD